MLPSAAERYNKAMRYNLKDSHYSEATGKLHILCPYRDKTGISVHVVIREGHCYRSRQCMLINCKFNVLQSDIQCLLSLAW